MKLTLILSVIFLGLAGNARAQSNDTINPQQIVCRSSVPINIVLIASHTPTAIETPKLSGTFAIEIQNRDASNDICCGFSISISTRVDVAGGNGCRQINKGGGSWIVQRWWQNLTAYCQSLSTTGTSAVATVQCK